MLLLGVIKAEKQMARKRLIRSSGDRKDSRKKKKKVGLPPRPRGNRRYNMIEK